MINLLPKDTVFYDLFEKLAEHVVSSARHLQQLAASFPQSAAEIQKIRDDEHAGDELSHTALARLDQTFITPIDREDIHTLIGGLDDIIDNVDALAKRITLYHVTAIEASFQKQCDVLVKAAMALSEAVNKLRKSRKLSDLNENIIEIHQLENIGDDIHHNAISTLFDGNHEALHVLKWKELYDYIENAIDGCEDVTNTLERIVLKNG